MIKISKKKRRKLCDDRDTVANKKKTNKIKRYDIYFYIVFLQSENFLKICPQSLKFVNKLKTIFFIFYHFSSSTVCGVVCVCV